MTGRLPESSIAPEHLDLRARVRLRHALVAQRGEWQQRIHAVLYHHGHSQKAGLLTAANSAWLGQLALPAAAREQVTVALAMIDALDSQSAAITAELRRYAPLQFQPTSRPLRRPGHHRPSVRPAPLARTPLPPRTARTALGALRSRAGRAAAGQPRPGLLRPGRRATRRQPRLPRPRAQAAQAQLPRPARTRRPSPATRLTTAAVGARAALIHTDAPRPAPQMPLPPPERGRPTKTERPQRVTPREQHPINHHVTDQERRVADRDKPGRPHAPHLPRPPRPQPTGAADDGHSRG